MYATTHKLFKVRHIILIGGIPDAKGRHAGLCAGIGVLVSQFLFGCGLIIVRQVAQKEKGKHIVAEVVRVHGSAQGIGNAPKDSAQLFLILFGHACSLELEVLAISLVNLGISNW